MRLRSIRIGAGVAIVPIALMLGWVLSLVTTRVANWFVMTDELYYERLAIAVAQTGSLLPRIHGVVVSNVNQLYPVILSPLYGDGNVPASLEAAHRLNAFVMASVAIPVYLLARRVGIGPLLSVWVGVLAVAVPWIALSSFLLTEVVAYPVFCWAILALTHATARRTTLADGLALASIGFAVLARTQFLVLVVVFAIAVVADALFDARGDVRAAATTLTRNRRLLLAAYLAMAAGVVVLALTAGVSRLLGSYATTAHGLALDLETLRLVFQQTAVLALGLAIVPFLVGTGWLVEQLRPSSPRVDRAFALVGCAAFVLLLLEVASFSQRFGDALLKDRYLFYVVPIVLVALAAAVRSWRWPRWWAVLVPTAVCAVGFATFPLPPYVKFNADSPLAMLNSRILDMSGSVGWGRALLVIATLVAAQFLLMARLFLSARVVAATVAALVTLALPAETVYAFDRLFAVNGTNGLPITLDQGVVFNWIDRAVAGTGDVTAFQYPVFETDYWSGVAYWWDIEFWNESVVQVTSIGYASPEPEPWVDKFDMRTGDARRLHETARALVHQTDVRFRLAGREAVFDRGAYIVEAERPWRASYVTYDIFSDGWTRPHIPATIRVFSDPRQSGPVARTMTIAMKAPEGRVYPVTVSSNLGRWEDRIAAGTQLERRVAVCIPVGGYSEIQVETPFVTNVYRDPTQAPLTGETDRPVGLLLRWFALADEQEPRDHCPKASA